MAFTPPQFQAQRPQAVNPVVIQQAPRAFVSFWGKVLPSLLQGAQAIRTMVEGDPGAESQLGWQRQQEGTRWEQSYDQSDNPELRSQMIRERAAKLREEGRDEEAALLEQRNPSLMNSKQQYAKEKLDTWHQVRDQSAAYRQQNASLTGSSAQTAPGQAPVPAEVPVEGQQAPDQSESSVQRTTSVGSDFMPAEVPVEGQDADQTTDIGADFTQPQTPVAPAGHPLLQQVSTALKSQGMDVPPEMLHANPQNGVVASLAAVAAGRMPFNPNAQFPTPVPGSADPGVLQAAQSEGAAKAPRLAEIVSSMGSLRVISALESGKEPNPEDMFAMLVDDAQAEQLLKTSMYKQGASPSQFSPALLFAMTDLWSDPDNAMQKLANDTSGLYQKAQEEYLRASAPEQVEIRKIVEDLSRNATNSRTLQFRVNKAKTDEQLARERQAAMNRHYQAQEEAARQRNQISLMGVGQKQTELDLKKQELADRQADRQADNERGDKQLEINRERAEFANANDWTKFKRANAEGALKSYGLSVSSDQERDRAKVPFETAGKQLAQERQFLTRMEAQLAKYRVSKSAAGLDPEVQKLLAGLDKGKANPNQPTMSGQPAQDTPEYQTKAISRITAEIEAAQKRVEAAQVIYNERLEKFNRAADQASKGVPSPGTFLQRYYEDDTNYKNRSIQKERPEFVETIKNLYNGAAARFVDEKAFVTAAGPHWKSFSPGEQKLLLEAFRTYKKADRK